MAGPPLLNLFNEQKQASSCSSPRPRLYHCPYCPRRFNSPKAIAGHSRAHQRGRPAARRKFPVDQPQPYSLQPRLTSTFPTPHATAGAGAGAGAPYHDQWLEPFHVHYSAAGSVPHQQGFNGHVSSPEALSFSPSIGSTDVVVDDGSANIDLALRL